MLICIISPERAVILIQDSTLRSHYFLIPRFLKKPIYGGYRQRPVVASRPKSAPQTSSTPLTIGTQARPCARTIRLHSHDTGLNDQ